MNDDLFIHDAKARVILAIQDSRYRGDDALALKLDSILHQVYSKGVGKGLQIAQFAALEAAGVYSTPSKF